MFYTKEARKHYLDMIFGITTLWVIIGLITYVFSVTTGFPGGWKWAKYILMLYVIVLPFGILISTQMYFSVSRSVHENSMRIVHQMMRNSLENKAKTLHARLVKHNQGDDQAKALLQEVVFALALGLHFDEINLLIQKINSTFEVEYDALYQTTADNPLEPHGEVRIFYPDLKEERDRRRQTMLIWLITQEKKKTQPEAESEIE